MPQKCKTPAGTGASRDCCGGPSHPLSNLEAWRGQFPILAAHCGPEWLTMIAAILLQRGGR